MFDKGRCSLTHYARILLQTKINFTSKTLTFISTIVFLNLILNHYTDFYECPEAKTGNKERTKTWLG